MTNNGAKSGSSQRKTEQSGRTRRTIGLVASSIALSAVLSQAGFAAPDKVAAVSESVSTGASSTAGGVVSGGVTEEVTLPDVDNLLNDTAGSTTGVSNGAQDPMMEPTGSTPAPPSTTALAAPSGSTPSAAPGPAQAPAQNAVAKPVPAANSLTGMTPINQVKLLYKQGKYRDALNVIASMKQSELTYYYAGLCYQGQGQLAKAAQAFAYTASVAKDPTIRYNAQVAQRAVASYARGRTYAGQGNMFASQSIRSAPRGGGGGGGGTVARS